jgi:hypothetical protein
MTFDGTGEVTCNLFGLYCFDTIHNGKANHRFQDMTKWYAEARAHIAGGAPYETWKSKPFLALTMYEQLAREFGWSPSRQSLPSTKRCPLVKNPRLISHAVTNG